jgi:double-stranded uracil-DNA glycosylase
MSAAKRQYYAHPQNRFWRVLREVGLTPRLLRPDEYRQLLAYGIGLTDIAKHVSGMDKDLPSGSLGQIATAALRVRIEACSPSILAFTSLTGASRFLGRAVQAGQQPDLVGSTRLWALPSPSPAANWNWSVEPWRQLAGSLEAPDYA